MSCILKAPQGQKKGILTFTSQERRLILQHDKALLKKIENLKSRWLVGLHHNWQDFNFHYNPLFDFNMAGDGDLIEVNGAPFPLINIEAANFSPSFFEPNHQEKFWDVLAVAQAFYFKRIPELFQYIRTLYDGGHRVRVLLICPIPEYDRQSKKTTFYNVREVYDSMFTEDEKDYFTLLTTDYRSPFPFDLKTISHFYRSSKIFVHAANEERRPRVAGYAWASGMPVVAHQSVGSLLPEHLRKEPAYFLAQNDQVFPDRILAALDYVKTRTQLDSVAQKAREAVSESYNRDLLRVKLKKVFENEGLPYSDSPENFNQLDIRLARHHGLGKGRNNIPGIDEWLNYLSNRRDEALASDIKVFDPEQYIAGVPEYTSRTPKDFVANTNFDFSFVTGGAKKTSLLVRKVASALKRRLLAKSTAR